MEHRARVLEQDLAIAEGRFQEATAAALKLEGCVKAMEEEKRDLVTTIEKLRVWTVLLFTQRLTGKLIPTELAAAHFHMHSVLLLLL